MAEALPRGRTLTTELISRQHLAGWWWLLAVGMTLGLVFVTAGVFLVARRRKNLSRPGRIAVVVIAAWACLGATAVFLDDVRHGGDWGGGIVQGASIVLYGLIGCAVVWAVERTLKKVLRRARLAP
jgi:ABC-type Co2+ transport system permease subunit